MATPGTDRREHYVRPPLIGDEPTPRWVGVWRFRAIVLLVALALAVLVGVLMLKYVVTTEQNPSFGSLPAATAAATTAVS
jgi:hypothetical protein